MLGRTVKQTERTIQLCVCASALQVCYLIWGILQERIMRHDYDGEHFKNSQFLVLVNRLLPTVASGLYLRIYDPFSSRRSIWKCSYCAVSNVASSWFQYEALKYVTYPTQVLSKSCKIVPVMIMGFIVAGRRYNKSEISTAALLSAGMSIFLLAHEAPNQKQKVPAENSYIGMAMMLGYMATDSFTSTWQNRLFTLYPKLSVYELMFGVNICSTVISAVTLVLSNSLSSSLKFLTTHPEFLVHCFLLSICSAIGQLFIYYSIKEFGTLTFVVIMTIKQALSISLSCVIYGHTLHTRAIFGILMIFCALFLRIGGQYGVHQLKKKE